MWKSEMSPTNITLQPRKKISPDNMILYKENLSHFVKYGRNSNRTMQVSMEFLSSEAI